MIDLHCHSTFSDGSLTPAELVTRASRLGLTALALTDHDGTDGVPALLAACATLPEAQRLTCIPGVEISVGSTGTMHLLGYFIDCANAPLQDALRRVRASREERNQRILVRLRELDCPLTWEEVIVHAGEDMVGRPHFAAALVAAGRVRTRQQAFERWLARGRPAYVERWRLDVAEALNLIRAAGGAPVLAHPVSLKLSPKALRQTLKDLKKMGLAGLEVYYPLHAPEQEGLFMAVARELDLVATGGSDFHGSANPAIELGRGFGGLQVPDAVVEALRGRCAA